MAPRNWGHTRVRGNPRSARRFSKRDPGGSPESRNAGPRNRRGPVSLVSALNQPQSFFNIPREARLLAVWLQIRAVSADRVAGWQRGRVARIARVQSSIRRQFAVPSGLERWGYFTITLAPLFDPWHTLGKRVHFYSTLYPWPPIYDRRQGQG